MFNQSLPKFFVATLLFLLATTSAFADHSVNINTAGLEELKTLTGIGTVKAQSVIDYRSENGPFSSIEEIKNVSGIGDVTFSNIQNHITVSGTADETPDSETETTQENTQPISSETGGGVFIEDTKSIAVDIGEDRRVIVGADTEFSATVYGALGEPITDESLKVFWSFGNGDRKKGKNILYNFQFPGSYVVVANVTNDVYSASDRVVVEATPADIRISEVKEEYIALKNNSSFEINIGGWILFSRGKQFYFPKDTILLSGQEVFVSNKRTGLSGSDPKTVALQYPNGVVATTYEYPLFIARSAEVTQNNTTSKLPASRGTEKPLVDRQSLVSAPVVASSNENDSVPFFVWLLGLLVLSGIAGAGLVYIRRQRSEYDIEEI